MWAQTGNEGSRNSEQATVRCKAVAVTAEVGEVECPQNRACKCRLVVVVVEFARFGDEAVVAAVKSAAGYETSARRDNDVSRPLVCRPPAGWVYGVCDNSSAVAG